MDSVTQFALGAAVGEAVLGRKIGNRALIWGGVCGTIPDLDVFIPLGDPVSDFTYHRSFSHSLFVLAAITPLIVAVIMRLHRDNNDLRWRWFTLVYAVFASHVLLDSFTAYGTQIFWPLFTTPMTWSTIFIIDPLYTLPLIVGIIAALVMTREKRLGHTLNRLGLILSSVYLAWTVGAKIYVDNRARISLDEQGIDPRVSFSTPAPFTSFLWRIVVMDQDGYYEGFYSIFDGDRTIPFTRYPSENFLLNGIEDEWAIKRLQWFSKGFFSVMQQDKNIVISDLRMGLEPFYIFRFQVGRIDNPHATPQDPIQLESERNFSGLGSIWHRIWDSSVVIAIEPRSTSG